MALPIVANSAALDNEFPTMNAAMNFQCKPVHSAKIVLILFWLSLVMRLNFTNFSFCSRICVFIAFFVSQHGIKLIFGPHLFPLFISCALHFFFVYFNEFHILFGMNSSKTCIQTAYFLFLYSFVQIFICFSFKLCPFFLLLFLCVRSLILNWAG